MTLRVLANDASYIAPQIAMKPMDLNMDAQIKDTFRVECVANGYPNLPSIRWFKDFTLISSSGPIYDLQKRNYLQITSTYFHKILILSMFRMNRSVNDK